MSILFLLPGWTQGIALFPVESLKDPRFLSEGAWEFQTPEFLELEMSRDE